MKSYEEMAQDVLQRRDAYVIHQKWRRRIVGTCVGCVCVAAALSIGVWLLEKEWDDQVGSHLDKPQILETTSTDQITTQTNPTFVESKDFAVLLSAEPGAESMELEEDLALPMNYKLMISDIRGMDQAGVKALREQHAQKIEDTLKQYSLDDGATWMHYNILKRDNYLISLIRVGAFELYIEDYEAVESIRIENGTLYGQMDIFFSPQDYYVGTDIILTSEQIPDAAKEGGLRFNWKYSNAVLEALEKDPTANLADFYDTVTFTVTYKDGAEKYCKVDILILENGSICAVLKETSMNT